MRLIALFTLLICFSCSPSKQAVHDEDYVLVEFASKLEEDYHKIQNIPYEPDFHIEKTEDHFDDGQLDDHHHSHDK